MRLLDKLLGIERLPGDDGPPLTDGERTTAWAADQPLAPSTLAIAVATNRALWLRDAGEATGWARLVWADVHKATWTGDVLTIIPGLEVEPGVVTDGPPRLLRLAEPRNLPKEVRARVTRSVAHTSHYKLSGTSGGVRVVARRIPGEDGLSWVLRFDSGVDSTEPLVRAEAERYLHSAQAAV
jgi:hypothetical protein